MSFDICLVGEFERIKWNVIVVLLECTLEISKWNFAQWSFNNRAFKNFTKLEVS